MRKLIWPLVALLLLGGCGVKGPLYLPDETAGVKATPADSHTTEESGKK
ncbi:MAG: lipopeptide [Betaproteobacteria bacterium]|nr:lipopeptide [Betaproteobacteria bacterium]